MNPGKHGIFGFLEYIGLNKYRTILTLDVKGPRLGEIVAMNDLVSIVMGLTPSYPIIKIKNQFVITDYIAPRIQWYNEAN